MIDVVFSRGVFSSDYQSAITPLYPVFSHSVFSSMQAPNPALNAVFSRAVSLKVE